MASFSYSEPNHNPWINEDKSLTSIKNALILGEKTGHIRKRYDDDSCDESSSNFDEEVLPSLKLISVQREISKKRRELNEVKLQIQKRMQDKETHDITHIDKLESKIQQVKELNNHLQSILSCKDQVVNRLQQPLVGDYIKIDAAYHRYVSELFPLVTPLLGDLNMHLDNISWIKSTNFPKGRTKLESVLTELSSAIAGLQSQYQALCQLRKGMNDMYKASANNR
ncbi:HAUS augmin-like complex subunit 2 [Patella vulgata]|uniref:HAUS augmin-like complex subunit 2 n=1 Tax=Patella vulgata TaxID=6465 RepID=UPI00217FD3AE|nr:HAUS augmin-like complex subunit 2 [Patella vulgata]